MSKPPAYDPAPLAARIGDAEFLRLTETGLPMAGFTRKQQRLWQHVAYSFAGRVLGDLPGRAPRRAERFSSVADAARAWVVTRQDGYGMTAVSDPSRLRRLVFLGPTQAGPSAGRWTDDCDAIMVVDAALADAWRTFRDPRGHIGPDHAIGAFLRRTVAGHGTDAIAADIAAMQGASVSPKRVGAVTRWCHTTIYGWLYAAGLVPREEIHLVDNGLFKRAGGDLRGWKAIAEFLGVSPSTAKRYAQSSGLPFYEIFGRVEARSTELQAWRDGMVVAGSPPSDESI
jgi:hypothetical protein